MAVKAGKEWSEIALEDRVERLREAIEQMCVFVDKDVVESLIYEGRKPQKS